MFIFNRFECDRYERFFTNMSVCCFYVTFQNNTSHVFEGMAWTDEINYHCETFAVVSNALSMVI